MKLPQIDPALRSADKIRILFVCLGNICRSPAAEGIMRSITEEAGQAARFEIDSAGTGNYQTGDLPDRRMRIHARARGYELTHRARQIHAVDFDRFDIIIPMDASNEAALRRLAPTVDDERKIIPMAAFCSMALRADAIPDPYYEGAQGFELVLDLLTDACNNLFSALK